jgi:protein dispatched 1
MADSAPPGMENYRMNSFVWAWMASEEAFIRTAVQGMAIAILFAFLVLLIATHNLLLTLISVFCVAYVVVSVVAIMVLKDWQLGISECICVVILIGFSVDYIVHLGSDYIHSNLDSRMDKMRQAYQHMGISIMSGMITTTISGAFLFGGVILTFNKFALLITSTIIIAFLVSMVLFGAILQTIGPEKNYCNVCPSRKKLEEEEA